MASLKEWLRGWLGLLLCFNSSLLLADEPPKYAFKLAPLEIYDRLNEVKLGDPPAIAKRERELLEFAWKNARSDQPAEITDEQFLDALIFASGVDKPEEVEKLRKAYQKVLAESKSTLKDCKTAPERAEKLLTFLHAGAMKGGYKLEKTTLAEIFETGEFNCVSSTAIYCLLGKAHGLKLQPISVPGSQFMAGHATVDLLEDGKRIQIEPTNADGFDWDAKINRPGVISLNFGPSRSSGHDVSYWNLPAMMYSNRGNRFKKSDASEELAMIRCYIASLALDPLDDGTTQNMRAALVNWGPGLIEAKKFEAATRAMEFAHLVAPEDGGVQNNREVAWERRIMDLLNSRKDAEAMEVAADAKAAIGTESRFKSLSQWFERLGDQISEKEGYEASLQIITRGEKVLAAEEMKALLDWRISRTRVKSQSLLQAKDYQESFNVVKRFYDAKSPNKELIRGIEFHAQEALPLAQAKGGAAEVIAHYRALREAFPECEGLKESGEAYANHSARALCEKKEFEQAVGLLDELAPLLESAAAKAELGERVYSMWVASLLEGKEIEQAIQHGAEGRKRFPESAYLAQSLRDAYEARIGTLLTDGKLDAAIESAGLAAAAFSADEKLKLRTTWLASYADNLVRSNKSGGWDAGAKQFETFAAAFSAEERQQLTGSAAQFARLWSQNRLKAEDYPGSLAALARLKPIADRGEIDSGLAYHIQEALPEIFSEKGSNGAIEHIKAIREAFPMHEGAEEGIAYFLRRRIEKAAESGDFERGMKLSKELAPAAKDDAARDALRAAAYVEWIYGLKKAQKWEAGLAKALEGMKEMPKQERIREQGVSLIDAWAKKSIDTKAWDDAIKIYERGLEHFPGDSLLANNLNYCKAKKAK